MSRVLGLYEKARKDRKKIVLPEGEDPRVVKAAAVIAEEGLADIVILGAESEIRKAASDVSVSLDKVNIIDPSGHDKKEEIVSRYYELRKAKGMTPEEAEETVMGKLVYYAAMMTKLGFVDGFVAGAVHTTSDVARSAIQCLRLDREIGTVSSAFIMEMHDCPYGENGLFAYGDCGIIPYPSVRQLAGIAISTSGLFKKLFGIEPRVAMLSYSTKGSAKPSETIETVLQALAKVKEKRPEIIIDGELQLDAAIVPEIAERKCPGSKVGGRANVLIFPNLDAGNISYKLSQRLGKAEAVGPIILGLDKPCSDLSRGSDWREIVNTTVVTAIRAQQMK